MRFMSRCSLHRVSSEKNAHNSPTVDEGGSIEVQWLLLSDYQFKKKRQQSITFAISLDPWTLMRSSKSNCIERNGYCVQGRPQGDSLQTKLFLSSSPSSLVLYFLIQKSFRGMLLSLQILHRAIISQYQAPCSKTVDTYPHDEVLWCELAAYSSKTNVKATV